MRFFSGPAVLIIDELGCLPMPSRYAAALFQVISRRYQQGSVILTTNRNVASWGDIFSDTTIAAAMWTGSSTEASRSPSQATTTGSAPTKPRPANTDRKETATRLSRPPQQSKGEFR